MEPNRPVFSSLNALRGLAAVAVAVFHAAPLLGRQIAPAGYLAVDLFFILSGFVIAHAYDVRFAAGLRARDFLVQRLLRFYPLYWLGMSLGAAWLALEILVSPPAILTPTELSVAFALGLLFLPSPTATDGDLYPLNVPAWSLFFEIIVNAAYALAHRVATTRRLVAFTIFAGLVLSWQTVHWGFGLHVSGLARAFFAFPLGVLIYRLRDRTGGPVAQPWLTLAVLLLLCVPMFVPVDGAFRRAFDLSCILVLFPGGILLLSRLDPGGPESRVAHWLGALSYPLYAIHYPVLQAGLGVAGQVDVSAWALGVMLLVGLLAASHHLDSRFDRPARKWLQRRIAALHDKRRPACMR